MLGARREGAIQKLGRSLVVCKRRRRMDEIYYFTMGGDKMASHWENILDCADEWVRPALT